MSILPAVGAILRTAFKPSASLPKDWPRLVARLEGRGPKSADEAFGRELARLVPRLRSYARTITRGGEAAEDLVQETLLRAWASRTRFEPGTNLRAWMFTILRNLFLTQVRRARFVGSFDEVDAERRLAHPGDQAASAEFNEALELIGRLPEEQREALTLVSLDGLTYDEAAAYAGTAIGTFKSRVFRARTALRVQTEATGDGHRRTAVPELPKAGAEAPTARSARLRNAWAEAKASGRPLTIG